MEVFIVTKDEKNYTMIESVWSSYEQAMAARLLHSLDSKSDLNDYRIIARYVDKLHDQKCPEYRPDHNGECLNCDEPADAHKIQE